MDTKRSYLCRASQQISFYNQPDASIIQICSIIKLYMFRASSLPIKFGIGKFHAGLMTHSKQSQDGTPDDGQRRCAKHVEFYNRINMNNWCIWFVIKKRDTQSLSEKWPRDANSKPPRAPPRLWLQKHTDLRADNLAHFPDLWLSA